MLSGSSYCCEAQKIPASSFKVLFYHPSSYLRSLHRAECLSCVLLESNLDLLQHLPSHRRRDLSRCEGFAGEGHCRNLILYSILIVESRGSIAEAHDNILGRIGNRNGTGLGSWGVKLFSALGREGRRTREFHALDEIVVGKPALRIIFNWSNGNDTQSILLSNCSSNEVESLLEVGVFH